MILLKQYYLACKYRARAKKLVKQLQTDEDMQSRASHQSVMRYLKKDNLNYKKHKFSKLLRDQAAFFYKSIRRFAVYVPHDYSESRAIYFENLQLGVNPELPAKAYLNCWVTAVAREYAYKGKKYGAYGGCWRSTSKRPFEPYTFLVGYAGDYSLVEVGHNDLGWDKNQVRLATEEEIAKVIDTQFILSEN